MIRWIIKSLARAIVSPSPKLAPSISHGVQVLVQWFVHLACGPQNGFKYRNLCSNSWMWRLLGQKAQMRHPIREGPRLAPPVWCSRCKLGRTRRSGSGRSRECRRPRVASRPGRHLADNLEKKARLAIDRKDSWPTFARKAIGQHNFLSNRNLVNW